MSARAAWRLESLGFTQVYRYTPGKADWMAFGLPWEGEQKQEPLAGDLARQDVPTCQLQDPVGEVRERTKQAGWPLCVVVNEEKVVLGILVEEALRADPQRPAVQAMREGVKTYRPDTAAERVLKYMREHEQAPVLVTKSDGTLSGILRREDVVSAVEG